jgi:hypothetical protein
VSEKDGMNTRRLKDWFAVKARDASRQYIVEMRYAERQAWHDGTINVRCHARGFLPAAAERRFDQERLLCQSHVGVL